MAIITSGAPTSKTAGNIGDHLVDSTTRKVYECISANTYGGHDAVTFKQKKKEYVWKCIGDDPNYGSEPYQQLVTDGNGNTVWEDRLAYEVSVTSDIAGLEYFIITVKADVDLTVYTDDATGVQYFGVEYEEIPLKLGQVWNFVQLLADGKIDGSIYEAEVQQGEDGTLYMGGLRDFPFCATKNKAKINTAFFRMSKFQSIKLVGVSGTYTTTAPKQIDHKYIPSQRFDVTISEDDVGNLVSDKTPAEILEAYNNGQIVNGIYDKFGINLSFAGLINDEAIFTVTDIDSGNVMFYIVQNDRTVVELLYPLLAPADNLPNGLILTTMGGMWRPSDSLILPSSTSGSTKKFKIAVDDTGTISATEVT